MSLPTPERLAAARWFGGKAGAIGRIEECDRLDLGGGALLSILRVDGADLYVWSEGEAASALLGSGSDPERGVWQYRDPGVTLPDGAEERPIGLDQSNTSYVVGERLVVKLYRRIWPGVHPEVELGRHLTETARLDCVPAFAGSLHWDGHATHWSDARSGDGWQIRHTASTTADGTPGEAPRLYVSTHEGLTLAGAEALALTLLATYEEASD